jgi:subtilisin family serine protease
MDIESGFRKEFKVIYFQKEHFVKLREVIPNDPQFSMQWALKNNGDSGGIADADIDATEVWDTVTGGTTVNNRQIVIAVVDDGFDLNHPDISFMKNTAEIPGNNTDDDNNGYIDDYDGWNAYNHSGSITSNSHGTHVTGICGALGNNNQGVCGINFNVKILPVQGSSGTESIVVEAYSYVYEMRMRYNESNGQNGAYIVVTNSSFGVDYGNPVNYPIWCSLYDSLGAAGVLSCAATANASINVDEQYDMPTACNSDYLITLTNTTRTDEKYASAGYGLTTIDLGAPGTQIRSTDMNSGYSNKTGTSMSSPHAAGAVALLHAAVTDSLYNYFNTNYGALALYIKQSILSSTDSLPSLSGITVSGGRLNVKKAIDKLLSGQLILNPPLNLTVELNGNHLVLNWETPIENTNSNLTGYNVYRDNVLLNESLIGITEYSDFNIINGSQYTYSVKAVYQEGISEASNYVTFSIMLAPRNLVGTAYNNRISLSWQSPGFESSLLERNVSAYSIFRDGLFIHLNPPQDTIYIDNGVENGIEYTYYVTAMYSIGESEASNSISVTITGTDDQVSTLNNERLVSYPNPFRQETKIDYYSKSNVLNEIEIYNCKGELVKSIKANHREKGKQGYIWNGEDSQGKRCSSGVFFYSVNGSKENKIRKMILLK